MIRHLFLGLALSGLVACSSQPASHQPADHEAEWESWLTDLNASYTSADQAVLTVVSALYLKPGQTAYLVGDVSDPSAMRWKLQPSEADVIGTAVFELEDPLEPTLTLTLNENAEEYEARIEPLPLADGVTIDGRASGLGTDDPRYVMFLYDRDFPAAQNFNGLNFFPYDPAYRVTAAFVPNHPPKPLVMQTERGQLKEFYEVGRAEFDLEGVEVSLPLYRIAGVSPPSPYLTAMFADAAAGKDTYLVGRYLDIKQEGEVPSEIVLDLNYAYNPLCARSPHYNCPLVETFLDVEVRAGEKYVY